MKFSSQNIETYNAIRPDAVLNHLREHGWQKQSDFSDRAEIWIYPTNQDNHFYEVLLPTTADIPDYASRIHDVFRMLELVENRPTNEIFNDLVDVRAIATDNQREVLNIHLNFSDPAIHSPHPDIEASAKALGNILGSLQSLFDAIGQVKAGQASAFGKISQEITTQTELSVLGTFRGSFGVRLAMPSLPSPEQLELNTHSIHESQSLPEQQSLGEKVVQEFIKLLQDSQEEKVERLSDRLTSLQRRTASNSGVWQKSPKLGEKTTPY